MNSFVSCFNAAGDHLRGSVAIVSYNQIDDYGKTLSILGREPVR